MACRPSWSSCADSIVDAGSTSMVMPGNASRAEGPSFPATRTSYVCPDTDTARLPHLAGGRDPDPARVHEIKVERPDPLEQAVQACLVEYTPEHGHAAGGGDAQVSERRGSRRVELACDANLVKRARHVFPSRSSVSRRCVHARVRRHRAHRPEGMTGISRLRAVRVPGLARRLPCACSPIACGRWRRGGS